MTNPNQNARLSLEHLSWMCGAWQGAPGPQRVSENRSEPAAESNAGLARTMRLADFGNKQVAFTCITNEMSDPASIPRLEYRAVAGSASALTLAMEV